MILRTIRVNPQKHADFDPHQQTVVLQSMHFCTKAFTYSLIGARDAQRLSSAARGGRSPERVGWNAGLGGARRLHG